MIKKYTLYMGLNDKETKMQKIATTEAYKIVENILRDTGYNGATIFEANGLYKHDNGQFVVEKTLRIEILDFENKGFQSLVSTLKLVFNQESIAVENSLIESNLY